MVEDTTPYTHYPVDGVVRKGQKQGLAVWLDGKAATFTFTYKWKAQNSRIRRDITL